MYALVFRFAQPLLGLTMSCPAYIIRRDDKLSKTPFGNVVISLLVKRLKLSICENVDNGNQEQREGTGAGIKRVFQSV